MRKLEGPNLGLEVQFNQKLGCRSNALKQNEKDNSVTIPSSVIVHRICSRTKQFAFSISSAVDRKPLLSLSANSETETQRWMADIRHLLKPRRYCCMERSYTVSIVDNAHSKVAGLTGLYGDMIANETGIFIRNVHTGEKAETFEWKEFIQFHLMTVGRPEDVKRICVMHTSKEFRCGVGELYIFCLDSNKLLQDLVTQGRGPRRRQKSLHNDDLEMVARSGISSLPSQLKSDPSFCIFNTYVNWGSNTSIASGIYEEIRNDVCSPESKTSLTNKIPCNLQMEPPALPPRQKRRPEDAKEDRIDMEQYSHPEISNNFEARQQNIIYTQETASTDYSSYVPMSPQLRDFSVLEFDVSENSKENDYVIMR